MGDKVLQPKTLNPEPFTLNTLAWWQATMAKFYDAFKRADPAHTGDTSHIRNSAPLGP
jgi:hypothetical protein